MTCEWHEVITLLEKILSQSLLTRSYQAHLHEKLWFMWSSKDCCIVDYANKTSRKLSSPGEWLLYFTVGVWKTFLDFWIAFSELVDLSSLEKPHSIILSLTHTQLTHPSSKKLQFTNKIIVLSFSAFCKASLTLSPGTNFWPGLYIHYSYWSIYQLPQTFAWLWGIHLSCTRAICLDNIQKNIYMLAA